MAKYLLPFILIPLLEAYLLYVLGQAMGFWPTLLTVIATGIVGGALAKREGLKVWRSWRQSLAEGRLPEEGLLGGVLVLIGGVLLITPGVLTDLAGLALLFTPSRRVIARVVQKHLEKKFARGGAAGFRYRVHLDPRRGVVEHFGGDDVVDIEGEVIEERRAERLPG